jgi:hypothetical protein
MMARWLALLGVISCLGCSGGDEWTRNRPKVFPTQGIVKLDGKPLGNATVIFHSASHSLSAQGTTGDDGRFVLTTFEQGDGAVEGKHKVVVTKRTYEEVKTRFHTPEEPSIALVPKELLPKRYADARTTTIEMDVTNKKNDLSIEVASK